MILLIDNYDGCSNNIYQLAGQFDPDIRIVRNDRITPAAVWEAAPSHIILSGGSALPELAGNTIEIVQALAGRIPMLGICLGYRVLCAAYGAACAQMEPIRQGQSLPVEVTGKSPLFAGVPDRFYAGFYHSLTVPVSQIPKEFDVVATCCGEAAAIAHKTDAVFGVQFHPESFLSEYGGRIMENFLHRP